MAGIRNGSGCGSKRKPTLPVPDAEKIKRKCGCALAAMVDEDETMEVASVGGRKPRVMARRILSEILQPRAEAVAVMILVS